MVVYGLFTRLLLILKCGVKHTSRGTICSFFFSSRRRHTRSDRDWSSDVCSSDLSVSPRLRGERTTSCWFRRRVWGRGPTPPTPSPCGSSPETPRQSHSGRPARALQIGRASCRERV